MTMFYVERSNAKGGWDIMCVASTPLTLDDIQLPAGSYPVNYELPALVGLPGMQARIRVDEAPYEIYDWAQIPLNPADPGSVTVWGWKLIRRDVSLKFDAAPSWMSVVRGGVPQAQVVVAGGEPAPKRLEPTR